jgi:hypothetical protein
MFALRVSLACMLVLSELRAGHGQVSLLEQGSGDMVARLTVKVAEQAKTSGLAEVTLTVTVEGGPTMEAQAAELDDSTAAWKATSTQFAHFKGERLICTEVLELQQVKPGQVSLPGVTVSFRATPDADWTKAKWTDLLPMSDNVKGDITLQPPEPFRWGLWLLGAAVVASVVVAFFFGRRMRRQPPAQLTPRELALDELDQLERQGGVGTSEEYHTQLSAVVRRYLAERFGVRAPQQTTAEFLAAVEAVPELAGERLVLLRDLFDRCDLAKFAPVSSTAEECRLSTALARTLIEQTPNAAPAITAAN